MARKFVDKSKALVQYAAEGLQLVKKVVKVGTDIGDAISNYTISGMINIHHLCFSTSLEKVASQCFNFSVNATFFKKRRVSFSANACLDVSFIKTISKVIEDKLFPGVQYFKSSIEKARSMFLDMDNTKDAIEEEMSRTTEEEEEMSTKRRIVVNDDEKYFQKIAYQDLPGNCHLLPSVLELYGISTLV